MRIKEYLRNFGIPLVKFAAELGLSRPTLDLYIDLYESGDLIPKERYDIIFHELFDDRTSDKTEFLKRIIRLKSLLQRDEKLGILGLSVDAADQISEIYGLMIEDMKNDDWNREIYEFIDILLKNYRDKVELLVFAKMIVYLYTDSPVEKISLKEKHLIGKIYHALYDKSSKEVEQYGNYYERFLEYRANVKKRQELEAQAEKNRIQELVRQVSEDLINSGVRVSKENLTKAVIDKL